MRKRIFYSLLVFSFTAQLCKAQTWSPVSSGISGTNVNTTWTLYAYDSVLFAGGWFNNAGGVSVNDIAQWNGTNWGTVSTGSRGFINAMAEYNGITYAGGEFDTIGGTVSHDIAVWNGSNWGPVGKGIKDVQYGVYAMAVYNGVLYAGGSFDSAGGKLIYGIAQWNGTNWSQVGTGIYAADEDDGVFAMTVYKGELYVAGGFDSAGGVHVREIAKWNGTNWANVGNGMNGPIYCLSVYNGNLYAGGSFDSAGGAPANNIAMWNGTTWSALDSGITGEAGWATVNALTVYNGALIVGGSFDTVNGKPINCIAVWDGTNWSGIGSINMGGSVDAMTVFNNSLYVGGGFDSVAGVPAKNIAMWTAPSAVHEYTVNYGVTVYPNPASNYLVLKTQGISSNDITFKIYNVLGQETINGNLHSEATTVDITALPAGVYLISFSNTNKQLSDFKFIKE